MYPPKALRQLDVIHLAHRDGPTIDQLEEMNLSHEQLCEIAALCWKWAQQYSHLDAYYAYKCRADRILNLSSKWQELEEGRRRESTRRAIEDATGSYQRLYHPQTLKED